MIKENIRVTNNNGKLDVIIYYKSLKTAQLIIKNNMNKKTELNTTNVIYQFTCRNDDCMHRSTNYIGSTTINHPEPTSDDAPSNGAVNDHQLTRHN